MRPGDLDSGIQTVCKICDRGTYNKCYGFSRYCADCSKTCPWPDMEKVELHGHCPLEGASRDIACRCMKKGEYYKRNVGVCQPLTNCTAKGLVELKPGGIDHDSQCGPPVTVENPEIIMNNSGTNLSITTESSIVTSSLTTGIYHIESGKGSR